MKKAKICSWIAFCIKAKTKVETLSQRNLKLMSRNPNEIVLARISSVIVGGGKGKDVEWGFICVNTVYVKVELILLKNQLWVHDGLKVCPHKPASP